MERFRLVLRPRVTPSARSRSTGGHGTRSMLPDGRRRNRVTVRRTEETHMTVRASVQQLRERLPELLDDAVNGGRPCVVRRNGKDYAVILGVGEWRRRTVAKRFGAPGQRFKVPAKAQARTEQLLAMKKAGSLTRAG